MCIELCIVSASFRWRPEESISCTQVFTEVLDIDFKSDKLAVAAKRKLEHLGQSAMVEDTSFLLWKNFRVTCELPLVLLTPDAVKDARKGFNSIAHEFDGVYEARTGPENFIEFPFDPTKAITTSKELSGITSLF
jgi:hypothetical protein